MLAVVQAKRVSKVMFFTKVTKIGSLKVKGLLLKNALTV